MPYLEFREGERLLFMHLLRPGRTVVGRSDACDVALPSESVSRTHCLVEQRVDGWWLFDRSRNGTRVNGEVAPRHLLRDGDAIELGDWHARFVVGVEAGRDQTTANGPRLAARHEELVEVGEGRVAASHARLTFTGGPHAGRTVVLDQPRVTLGGVGADVELAPGLPLRVATLRVVRGRVMVDPEAAAVHLAGARLRELTPVFAGEAIRIGEHTAIVEIDTDDEPEEAASFGEMVGNEPVMKRLFGVLSRMAAHEAPVLLTGESGTGKELAARGLHSNGPRFDGPFVAVNCAAIAETLFESELFGHEKGAFTGATHRQDGAFQRADGGTLFLDEIGELDGEAQAKLLRALESGEVRRVGGSAPEFPDVRVVAATNRDLPSMVAKSAFRSDLYFRLAVLTVRLPSLAERRGDIGLLARTLVARNHPGTELTPGAVRALEQYEWPGNIRELRNVLTRAAVLGGRNISAGDLTFHPWAFDGEAQVPETFGNDPDREQVATALRHASGNRSQAARSLGIPRSSLLYKLRKYGLG